MDIFSIPREGNSISIYIDSTANMLFGGIIASIVFDYVAPEVIGYTINCVGYWRLFDRRLVVEHYQNGLYVFTVTSKTIIEDIVANYTDPALGFTTNHVSISSPIIDVLFNYRYPSDCLRELAEVDGAEWFIDADKDIHYFIKEQAEAAPLAITDVTLASTIEKFQMNSDYSQIRNRVYVQGGYSVSDTKTVKFYGNGEQRYWSLPYRPGSISLKVDGVSKTPLGQENIDTDDGTYPYFYNKYEQTLFCAAAESTPGNVVLEVTMTFEYPLLVRMDDDASQLLIASAEGGDGIYEYVVKDTTLQTRLMVEHRGTRELKKYSYPRIEGSFSVVDYYGFKAGQAVTVNITSFRYNGEYFIRQVTIDDIGNNILRYNIEFEGDTDE